MKEFWDARYREDGFAYGSEPNEFIKDCLDKMQTKGRILFPAEGEGRNAVYAAILGWDVYAYDISEGGKEKALSLAIEKKVKIDYQLAGFLKVDYPESFFDAIAFSYVHMPNEMKLEVFQRHLTWLKPGGRILFEGFSTNNLDYKRNNPSIGGPDHIDMLYTPEELTSIFGELELKVWEEEVWLNEGKYHTGKGMVVRAC